MLRLTLFTSKGDGRYVHGLLQLQKIILWIFFVDKSYFLHYYLSTQLFMPWCIPSPLSLFPLSWFVFLCLTFWPFFSNKAFKQWYKRLKQKKLLIVGYRLWDRIPCFGNPPPYSLGFFYLNTTSFFAKRVSNPCCFFLIQTFFIFPESFTSCEICRFGFLLNYSVTLVSITAPAGTLFGKFYFYKIFLEKFLGILPPQIYFSSFILTLLIL